MNSDKWAPLHLAARRGNCQDCQDDFESNLDWFENRGQPIKMTIGVVPNSTRICKNCEQSKEESCEEER